MHQAISSVDQEPTVVSRWEVDQSQPEEPSNSCLSAPLRTTTPMCSDRKPSSKRKNVTFQDYQLDGHPAWSDDDLSEPHLIWYSKVDYRQIRAENKTIAKLIKQGFPERLDFCFRGLEYKQELTGKLRDAKITKAWDLVLDYTGESVEELADLYANHTRACRIEAHYIGISDAKIAKAILQDGAADSTPRKPRRTWARAC